MTAYKVSLNNQQTAVPVDAARLKEGVKRVLEGEGIKKATISIAVVDDPAMHKLNLQYLKHDYPTDVLSFLLEQKGKTIEGEIILSADYAAREAKHFGWGAQDEMLLYAIHGALHLVGFDDQDEDDQEEMREKEAEYLETFGLTPSYDDEEEDDN